MGKILISTQELNELLGQPGAEGAAGKTGLVLLDARPTMAYLFSHIPGAVNVNWKNFSNPDLPIKSLLDSDLGRLEKKVGDLGVSENHRVIVYADPFECWGDEGRIYWMLSYLSHPNVQVLDGGWFKWKQEGRQVERGPGKAVPARFKARVDPNLLMVKDELKQRITPSSPPQAGKMVIIDARTLDEYLGQRPSGLPREGHIPGAVNIAWNSFFNPDGTIMPVEEIQKVARGSKVTGDKEVVTYCTGGVRSAWLYLVFKFAGFDNVKNYAGSWMEWSQDMDLPIER
jgi:thiosulfate/3-mercaptopyruvate sulfurtransferase